MRNALFSALLALSAGLFAGAAHAENYEVLMLDRGETGVMVFEPAFLQIQPGDSVTFVPTDRGHNAETMAGMVPEGAEGFSGRINEEFTVTFDVEGAYGYKCKPHLTMAMVGLIVVGDNPANLGTLMEARMPALVREKFESFIEQIGA